MIAGLFWSLSAALGYRALFVAFLTFPALMMHAGGVNPLLPEWWAMVALLGGFFAIVRGHDLAAGVFGLAAVLFRETFGVWLLSLGLAATLFALRDPRVWRKVAVYAALLAAGVAGYLIHAAAARATSSLSRAGDLPHTWSEVRPRT